MTLGNRVEQAGQRNNFDFLRFGLACTVIFSHCFPLSRGAAGRDPLMWLSHGQENLGTMALHGFFAISGFLVTQSWLRSRGPGSYFKKRFLRIYPGFIVCMLIDAMIVAPLSIPGHRFDATILTPGYLLGVLRRMALLREYAPVGAFATNPFPGAVNGAIWTIGYEFRCYILLALIGLVGLLRRPGVVVGLFLAVLALVPVVAFRSHGGGINLGLKPPWSLLLGVLLPLEFWPGFLGFFLAGVAAYLLRNRIPFRASGAAASIAALLAAAVLPGSLNFFFIEAFLGVYLLMWLAYAPEVSLHHFGGKGDFSYGIYLYGFPLQQLVVHFWKGAIHPLVLFGCVMPLALLAGMLSWHLVEHPFLRLKPKPPVSEPPLADAAPTPQPVASRAD